MSDQTDPSNLAVSRRLQAVQQPIIPVVAQWIRANPGTISLGQGVAYFRPPPDILGQVQQFPALADHHQYGPVDGLASLREALAEKLHRRNGMALDGQDVLITAGSNMGFFYAILAITDPGDEVILASPYYFNHRMAVMMANSHPVLVPTDARYHLQPRAIEAAFTGRTRAVVTISPNNPTGAVYPRSLLREINALCADRGLFHISDEAYEDFVYGDRRHFSPGSLRGGSNHTISLFSFSKAYGFASWRMGYMVVPRTLYEALEKIQDTVLICPPAICQTAALGVLKGNDAYRRRGLSVIAEIRDRFLRRLSRLAGRVECSPAEGAFYILIRVSTELEDMTLVRRLIEEYRVAAVPGSAFGLDKGCFIRIAFGSLEPTLADRALERLVEGLDAFTMGQGLEKRDGGSGDPQ